VGPTPTIPANKKGDFMSQALKSIVHEDEMYVNLNQLILFFMNQSEEDVMISKDSIVKTLTKYRIGIESKNKPAKEDDHISGDI
jgi:hypothetical protein